MSTTLVIIGLPASGKTTVFNALTGSEAETGTYSGDTAEPNLANVKVPDARLDTLTEMFNHAAQRPKKRIFADALTDYLFNKKVIHHMFCSTCGLRSFARGATPDGKATYAVNLRCVDDLDVGALKTTFFDGRSR